jgi:hypothetical protein
VANVLSWALAKLSDPQSPPPLEAPEPEEMRPLEALPPAPPRVEDFESPSLPESGERLSLRPPPPQTGTPLAELMAKVVSECRGHVLERIRKANDMTSSNVIAVGNSLDQIVRRAQEQVKATRATLDTLSGADKHGVTELIERQAQMSATRFAAIRAALQEQTVLTRQALKASSEIATVGAGVTQVAFQARLLSLNANIEAARFGERGAGFQVIATEMRRLTEEIDRANRQIESMATGLMGALPKISQHADELCRHADGFTEELAASTSAVSSATTQLKKSVNALLTDGDRAASEVLAGSHDALSHLQFQDPTAQNLLIIDADLARLAEHIETLLKQSGSEEALVPESVELDLRAAEANLELNAGTVAAMDHTELQQAGEVLLF